MIAGQKGNEMKVALFGGSGLIGGALSAALADEGHEVRVITRSPERVAGSLRGRELHRWDPDADSLDPSLLDGVDAVANLAGESIAGGRWTAKRKLEIQESRVLTGRKIVAAMAARSDMPKLLIAGSAVGYYGEGGDRILTEEAGAGDDFLARVCAQLEAEALRAEELGVRVIRLRTGVVLSPRGGALPRLLPLFRLGLGGPIGDGRQFFPWIHAEDLTGILLMCLQDESIEGAVNAAAPGAATFGAFAANLGTVLGRPARLRVPAWALRLMLGEMAGALLASQRVEPKTLIEAGFRFRHGSLGEALRDLLAER